MTPKEVVKVWIEKFNAADSDGLAKLYAVDAVNDQVVFSQPLIGRKAIQAMFALEFSRATMVCIEEQIFESGDWAILQWKDPLGLRGCGFFQVSAGQIVHQIGYFDQLTFFKLQGLPIPDDYLAM
ncbi:MAG TPA: nuclear transport factor 2 family protein [Anaerolineae bacterium]|nr:nuclear transport factor 2 family protein [Anaerolineae bacterium]